MPTDDDSVRSATRTDALSPSRRWFLGHARVGVDLDEVYRHLDTRTSLFQKLHWGEDGAGEGRRLARARRGRLPATAARAHGPTRDHLRPRALLGYYPCAAAQAAASGDPDDPATACSRRSSSRASRATGSASLADFLPAQGQRRLDVVAFQAVTVTGPRRGDRPRWCGLRRAASSPSSCSVVTASAPDRRGHGRGVAHWRVRGRLGIPDTQGRRWCPWGLPELPGAVRARSCSSDSGPSRSGLELSAATRSSAERSKRWRHRPPPAGRVLRRSQGGAPPEKSADDTSAERPRPDPARRRARRRLNPRPTSAGRAHQGSLAGFHVSARRADKRFAARHGR